MVDLGIANVASITAICMIIGYGVKCSKLDSKWIPVIVALFGGLLGLTAYLTNMPDFPADNIITAIAVGIISGLSGTGINQMYKQLNNGSSNKDNSDESNG